MDHELSVLCVTAATIGVLHTLMGPDHYVPFVAMSRVGGWTFRKTMWVTFLCGIGHVVSSVLLGAVGIVFGVAVLRLESIESVRGEWAGWLLIAFGLAYLLWGIRRAVRYRPHSHWHGHEDGTVHKHRHIHETDHVHVHTPDADSASSKRSSPSMTPWVLFAILIFGPCEPLIPVLMYPAAKGSLWHVGLVTMVFAVATLGTMMTTVAVCCTGVQRFQARYGGRAAWIERYSHAVAGLAVFLCGAAVTAGL